MKKSLATLGTLALLVTGGITAGSVANAPQAQAAPCVAVQGTQYITGTCDRRFTLSFKCVGIRGSWAYGYDRATTFRIKKPCAVVYAMKIK